MKPRLRHFLLGCALFLILGEISARPREERSPNLRKTKTTTQQYGDKKKQTKPSLRKYTILTPVNNDHNMDVQTKFYYPW